MTILILPFSDDLSCRITGTEYCLTATYSHLQQWSICTVYILPGCTGKKPSTGQFTLKFIRRCQLSDMTDLLKNMKFNHKDRTVSFVV